MPISLPSSDKPARPKRLHSNAQIFDDSEGENSTDSDLDKPVAKRLRQMPAKVKDVVSTHTGIISCSTLLPVAYHAGSSTASLQVYAITP